MRHTLLFLFFLACSLPVSQAQDRTNVLVVVGPSNHPPGSHEVGAGGRLLDFCLDRVENLAGVEASVVEHWPDEAKLNQAHTIVFIGDTFPANRFPNAERNLADLDKMMARGGGIVCIHYATGLLGSDVTKEGEHPLLHWMGGYFANRSCPHHESIAKIYPAATITPSADSHPIHRGWKEFTLHDEPYTKNYFGKEPHKLMPGVVSLATSMLPPEAPQKETVAWCIERPDSGRGFGIVMPHFYRNWKDEDLRKFIMNGILWTAKRSIPEEGVRTPAPDLAQFNPASIEPVPPKPKAKSN